MAVAVGGLLVYALYSYHDIHTRLKRSEEKGDRLHQQHDSLSAQLQGTSCEDVFCCCCVLIFLFDTAMCCKPHQNDRRVPYFPLLSPSNIDIRLTLVPSWSRC